MKLVSNEKTEQNTVTLKFTIAKDVFDAQTEKVYNRKKNKITIQGFRPGKAPRHMIEKIYGKGVFYEDALNDLLPGEYAEALKESGIKAVAQPEIDVESIDENGVLSIPVKKVLALADAEVARITVTVHAQNYADFTVTVMVYARNQIVPTGNPKLSDNGTITYGEKRSKM